LKGISRTSFDSLCERNKVLKEARQVVRMIFGNRRELGAINRKYDAATVAFMMPHYDQDWKDMVEWKSKLKNEDQANKGNITIVMKDYSKREKE